MLVFRTLTLGLLGACLWTLLILVDRGEPRWCAAPRPPVPAAPAANAITIIDLAHVSAGAWRIKDLANMIRLDRDEQIVAVNDHPVRLRPGCSAAPDYCNGALLDGDRVVEGLPAHAEANRFADFTIASGPSTRRVLVLIH